MGDSWGSFFRGLPAKTLGFFRELGGPISIILVAAFPLVSTLRSGTGILPSDYSARTNVIWGVFIFIVLLAVIFSARSDESRIWDFIKRWGGLIALALLLIFPFLAGQATAWIHVSVAVLLILLLIVPVAVRFLNVFTRPLRKQPEDEVRKIVLHMVRFCYVFMLIALSVSFLPPFVVMGMEYLHSQNSAVEDANGQSTKVPQGSLALFYRAMVKSPVGLVRGCLHVRRETDWELACHAPDTPSTEPSSPKTPSPKTPSTQTLPSQVRTDESGDIYVSQWLFNIGGSALRQQTVETSQEPAQTPSQLKGANSLFYAVTIYGGLAVPWYFIALAVMGAAVSMARKVPEYQSQVQITDTSDDDKTSGAAGDSNALSPTRVRELLVFQIMQVFSAPLIAITAYNTVMPTSRSTSVALAFASGFASESVLLAIQSFAEKIKPAETAREK